jgi:hypothetical protein
VQLTVGQATPTITWPNPSTIIYGTALSATQLNASASSNGNTVQGSFVYNPAAGTTLSTGAQLLNVTFTPTDTADFTRVTKTVSLTVAQATLTVAANDFTRLYGTTNPIFTGSVSGAQNGDTFTESFSTSSTINSQAGQYAIVPSVTGANLARYAQVVHNGTLTVAKAPVVISTTLSTTSIAFGLNVTMTANVVSTTTGTPTGTVTFLDNGTTIGTGNLTNGVASFVTSSLQPGNHVIVAFYGGDTNFVANTASGSSGANTITITPLDFKLVVTSQPTVEGIFGQTKQFTFHIEPVGGTYPGDVQLSASETGPTLSVYTLSQTKISKTGGPSDFTLTIATRRLSSLDKPNLAGRLSQIALGLFILPVLGLRYTRRSRQKLGRVLSYILLIALSLGGVGALTGCGSGYADHVYPIAVTAQSGGIQHTVTVNFHIDKSPQ